MRYPNPLRVTKSAILAVTRYIPEDIGKMRKPQVYSNGFLCRNFRFFRLFLAMSMVYKTGGWGFESLLSCHENKELRTKSLSQSATVICWGSYTGNNPLRHAALEKAGVEFITESGGGEAPKGGANTKSLKV
jgi:hypothetical protein